MLETLTSAHTVMNYGITCTWVIAHDSFLLLKNQQEVWLKITHVISSNVCIFFNVFRQSSSLPWSLTSCTYFLKKPTYVTLTRWNVKNNLLYTEYWYIYLQKCRLKLLGALADHRRMVLTVLLPYPGIGLSKGIANTTC